MIEKRAKIIIEAEIEIIEEIIKFLEKNFLNKIEYKIEKDLTKREKEILKLICESKSNNEIGKILNISQNTVKAYVKNICQKWNVKDRVQIVIKAIKENL